MLTLAATLSLHCARTTKDSTNNQAARELLSAKLIYLDTIELYYIPDDTLTRTPVTIEEIQASYSWKIIFRGFLGTEYPALAKVLSDISHSEIPQKPSASNSFHYGMIMKNSSGELTASFFFSSGDKLGRFNDQPIAISDELAQGIKNLFESIDKSMKGRGKTGMIRDHG